jgi:hypothetical protein
VVELKKPPKEIVESPLTPLGFKLTSGGGHDARTMMSEDIAALFRSLPEESSPEDYAQAVLEDNVLGKSTDSNRKKTLGYLRRIYSLDPILPVFRCFRFFAYCEPSEIHQLALLCAHSRDPLLSEMAPLYLKLPVGRKLERETVEEAIEECRSGQYSYKMKRSMAQNLSSSFTHAGYLRGKATKERVTPSTGPAAVAYALLLSYMLGKRGQLLFETSVCQLLDRPSSYLQSLAHNASLRGWINYKSSGGVVDVSFPELLTEEEIALSNGQD